uniref:Uncharacterized protein n=1 Tax=Cacopsylla melanoneura TaxID=428564 RepID=A0A8D8ZA31_9HEMI
MLSLSHSLPPSHPLPSLYLSPPSLSLSQMIKHCYQYSLYIPSCFPVTRYFPGRKTIAGRGEGREGRRGGRGGKGVRQRGGRREGRGVEVRDGRESIRHPVKNTHYPKPPRLPIPGA